MPLRVGAFYCVGDIGFGVGPFVEDYVYDFGGVGGEQYGGQDAAMNERWRRAGKTYRLDDEMDKKEKKENKKRHRARIDEDTRFREVGSHRD